MTTVPIWQHIITVLALLGANTFTFFILKNRVDGLQAALLAKRVLLGQVVASGTSRHSLAAGEILSIRRIPGDRVDIKADAFVNFDVVYFR